MVIADAPLYFRETYDVESIEKKSTSPNYWKVGRIKKGSIVYWDKALESVTTGESEVVRSFLENVEKFSKRSASFFCVPASSNSPAEEKASCALGNAKVCG